MQRHSNRLMSGALVVLALSAAGCTTGGDAGDNPVPATISLSQGSSAVLASVASGLVANFVGGGPIDMAQVDSLLVIVTRVDVLPDSLIRACHPPVGDSVAGFRPGRNDLGRPGPMGPGPLGRPCGRPPHRRPGMHPDSGFPRPPMRPDSLRPDSGFGRPMHHWYTLDVTGNGRVDLLNLPTTTAAGIALASGSLPAGDYGAARLIVSTAVIWFNTAITTTSGVTLNPNTAYRVQLPRMADKMGIVTNAGFTVPDGGGTVSLVFDANATVGGAAVTDSGTVILLPVLRPHRR